MPSYLKTDLTMGAREKIESLYPLVEEYIRSHGATPGQVGFSLIARWKRRWIVLSLCTFPRRHPPIPA